jgi:hypothetical protein
VVFIPVLAVITHSLMSTAARFLDRMFFRDEARQLRSNLQRLMRLAGEGADLDQNLEQTLESLCASTRATYGMILTFDEGGLWQSAAYHWYSDPITLQPADLAADDVAHLAPGQFQPPLEEAALLVPLYGEEDQVGALILGRPMNGIHYTADEVTNLLNLTDRIGEIIASAHRKAEKISQIAHLAEPLPIPKADSPITAEMVEDTLRNLHDYSHLADSPLAHTELVRVNLPGGIVTHLERGKAVHDVILRRSTSFAQAENLHDPPPRNRVPLPRSCDAYMGENVNREIMMRLYISELSAARRSAIRSVASGFG